jgi:Acetyl xylan esterase (AXE1)
MPIFEMPLAELKRYRGRNPKPKDFDAYWVAALHEFEELDGQAELQAVGHAANFVECFDLRFTGVGGARIYAKYVRPRHLDAPAPALVVFHGYRGGTRTWGAKQDAQTRAAMNPQQNGAFLANPANLPAQGRLVGPNGQLVREISGFGSSGPELPSVMTFDSVLASSGTGAYRWELVQPAASGPGSEQFPKPPWGAPEVGMPGTLPQSLQCGDSYRHSCSQSTVSKSCPIASGPSLSVASGCLRFRDVLHASSSSR